LNIFSTLQAIYINHAVYKMHVDNATEMPDSQFSAIYMATNEELLLE
jgi:hypothetical protein